jgi:hypothetical protein
VLGLARKRWLYLERWAQSFGRLTAGGSGGVMTRPREGKYKPKFHRQIRLSRGLQGFRSLPRRSALFG